jgi:DNA topoisomerase-1
LPEPESDGEEKPKKRAKAKDKPRTASLFKDMSLDTVSLEEALRLLSLPRIVGKHPDDGNDIVARNGRYGPYITWNKDSRSLPDEPSLFTIDQAGALALLAQPKQRGRQAAAPGKEIGEDPNSKQMITLKDGRFGPYVTDGETNASLRRADDPETITLERAVELLAERRAAGPAKKRAKKAVKKTAKRAPKKATKKIAKKAAKKATA